MWIRGGSSVSHKDARFESGDVDESSDESRDISYTHGDDMEPTAKTRTRIGGASVYPEDLSTDDALVDLLNRKEYYMLKNDDEHRSRPDEFAGRYLKPRAHQLFAANFHRPDTPWRALFLDQGTGTGKTLTATMVAQEYIAAYTKIYQHAAAKLPAQNRRTMAELDKTTPSIFIVGASSTKGAFLRELLRYPEFGFISSVEREEFLRRSRAASSGFPDDAKALKDMNMMLKKRLTSKARGGFYKFYGYDEFVNRLFLSEDVSLVDLEADATSRRRRGESVTLEQLVREAITAGKIKINDVMLKSFDGSLIICDEAHETYNMNMKNNRGVAIQIALDMVPSMNSLFLTATSSNNVPSEVVDLIGYLLPPGERLAKTDVFANSRQPLPDGIEKLARAVRGRVSFLQDSNIKYFPRREFVGEELTIPEPIDGRPAGDKVPYLKFVECPMTEIHQATLVDYQNRIAAGDVAVDDEYQEADVDFGAVVRLPNINAIAADGYAINDMVYPNPDSDTIGLFKSAETRLRLIGSENEWRRKVGVVVSQQGTIDVFSGPFLRRENVGKWSAKAAKMLDIITEIMSQFGGDPARCAKIWIFHPNIRMSGVIQIQEILRENGFIEEFGDATDATICATCGRRRADHSPAQIDSAEEGAAGQDTHSFRPARFAMAHGDIDRRTMEASLARYNLPDNRYGQRILILVGSKIVKQSYEFKDVQETIIYAPPTNIPTFIQVIGRVARTFSHENLPPERRQVRIHILVSTIDKSLPYKSAVSPEVERYVKKLNDYIVIQQIEKTINSEAIDANILRDIIMTPDVLEKYSAGPALGNLYFEPRVDLAEYRLEDLNITTFNAYGHATREVESIVLSIKRLFLHQPVWTYDDLLKTVRNPPFGVEVNPSLISEGNFMIALSSLITPTTPVISQKGVESAIVDKLFDPNERYIHRGTLRYKIELVGGYFIMFPVTEVVENPLDKIHSEYSEVARDRERIMIKTLAVPVTRVFADIESFARQPAESSGIRISVRRFISEAKNSINYVAKRDDFIARGAVDSMLLTNYSAQFQQSLIEEAIVWANTGVENAANAGPIYASVIDFYSGFGIVVRAAEIRKYRDTARQFKFGVPGADDMPVGYQTARAVRLFDPMINADGGAIPRADGKWIESSRISLNRQTTPKENDVVIGYFESVGDRSEFKVRPPVQKLNAIRGKKRDARVIERGGMCGTREKGKVMGWMADLGISLSKLDTGDLKVGKLCVVLMHKLLENEVRERRRDTRVKYIYGWWDDQNIASML